MKTGIKKRLFALLAASVAALLVTACTGTGEPAASSSQQAVSHAPDSSGGAEPASAADGLPAPDPDTKYEISFYSYWCGELDDGSYCEKLIEDALGVEIKVRKVANTNLEQVNLMLASGDMPDVAWLDKTVAFMKDEELSRTIPRAMVERYAPSFITAYDERPILYAEGLSVEDAGQFECLPGISDTYVQLFLNNDCYRYDWILNTGVDPGVEVKQITDNIYLADKGIEKDKFREIMDAFVNKDPDGNGKKDTIGMCLTLNNRDALTSGFDFIAGVNESGGKAVQWYAHPAYREYLKFFQAMYQDGLADNEWPTQDRNACWEKVNTETAGYWHSSTNSLNTWAIDRPPLTLIEKNPEAKILLTPGLVSDTGNGYQRRSPSPLYGRCYINAKMTDDQKLAKILEFLEYTNFGPETTSLFYGEEGINWEWDGDAPKVTNPLLNGVNGTKAFVQFMQIEDLWRWMTFEPTFALGADHYVLDDGGLWNKNQTYDYKYDIRQETEYSNIQVEISSDLNAVVDTYYVNCILGKNDVDATWDAYLAELNAVGYDRMMAELDKIPAFTDMIKEYSK